LAGREEGRPTKWVSATVHEVVDVGKPGVTFEVWDKWKWKKRKRKKLGTLTISVGGLRWWPHRSPISRQRSWRRVAAWLENE